MQSLWRYHYDWISPFNKPSDLCSALCAITQHTQTNVHTLVGHTTLHGDTHTHTHTLYTLHTHTHVFASHARWHTGTHGVITHGVRSFTHGYTEDILVCVCHDSHDITHTHTHTHTHSYIHRKTHACIYPNIIIQTMANTKKKKKHTHTGT